MSSDRSDDIAIVVAGQAGQGIQTIESILTMVLKRSGYHVFATKEYMSRIRGGSNSTLIRVGRLDAPANVDRIDILVPLDAGALEHLQRRISETTVIVGDRDNLNTEYEMLNIPFTGIAKEVGGKIYANTVAIAALCGMLDADLEILKEHLKQTFGKKGEEVVAGNLDAADKGFLAGKELRSSDGPSFQVEKSEDVTGAVLVSGGQAVSLGAVCGGCRFVASYPMSPGTAVLTYMSRHDSRFGLIVEQAEDEIAAVNMAIGAWYGGARAMVTTSGGGFDLMQEGISLAGITETPLVVHLGQRPGPSTGMATRTEQADLDLVLHAGHGEFPRVVYAPGTIEEAFRLTFRAFEVADRFQIPVFVLTDQYLIDSYYCVPELDAGGMKVTDHTVTTSRDYRRYALTDDGVSPRGVPGAGDGFVCVDSHEHTEEGHITEDIDLRNAMTEKRMGKLKGIMEDPVEPSLLGPDDYSTLVVCWGSNYHIVEEAVQILNRDDIAAAHFSQVHPLPPSTGDLLGRAKRIIVVENNFTGQFERVLRAYAGFEADASVHKFDGRPFCSEDLADRILKLSGKGGRT